MESKIKWALGLVLLGVMPAQAQQGAALSTPQTPRGSGMAPTTPDWVAANLPGAKGQVAVPPWLKYTGHLEDSMGRPKTGVVSITFALYEEEQGGPALWMETQNVELDQDGYYSAVLGTTQTDGLAELIATGRATWLGVQPWGEAEKRVLLVSVPYAFKAQEADKLAGKSLSDVVLVEQLLRALDPRGELSAKSISGAMLGEALQAAILRELAAMGEPRSIAGLNLSLKPAADASFDNLSARVLNNVRMVDRFVGETAGEKIAQCIADLPAIGGVCDARGLVGTQTITGLTIDKPVSLLLGNAIFIVTDSIRIRNVNGVQIIGMGGWGHTAIGTEFRWVGTSARPVFLLSDVSRGLFTNFRIRADSQEAPATVAIYSENGPDSTVPPRDRVFRDIYVEGVNFGITKGFQYAAGPGGDANNDTDTFDHVRVVGYSIAGWSFEHSQSKANRFYSCHFYGNKVGKYGITTALGPGGQGGTFMWFGGDGGGNTIADFYLGRLDDTILISGGNFENSSRLLETFGNSNNAWPILIEGVRWASEHMNSDNRAIVYTHRGTLTLTSNLIGSVDTKPLAIHLEPIGSSYGIAMGNQIRTSLQKPFTGNVHGRWAMIGNALRYGPSTLLADSMPGIAPPSVGTGTPVNPCTTGSTYVRQDGGAGSTLYVCEGGSWAAK